MTSYNTVVRQYFNRMEHVGALDEHEEFVARGEAGERSRGNVVLLSFKTNAHGIVTEAKFKTYGCGVAIAATAWLAEQLIGRSVKELKSISAADIVDALQLTHIKYHCALLAEEAMLSAVNHWEQRYAD